MIIPAYTYAEFGQCLEGFKNGHLQLLAIIGAPGLQKSMTAAKVCPESDGYCHLSGKLSDFQLYRETYNNKDRNFLFDDAEYGDGMVRSILKCLCDTKPIKTLHWHSASTQLKTDDGKEIPRKFTTESRVILIANDYAGLTAGLGPLEDRGLVLEFKPSAKEVHQRIKAWFKNREIYCFIGNNLSLIPRPSMRYYKTALELKAMGMDWRAKLLQAWNVNEYTALVIRLLADKKLTQNQRVEKFVKEGGGCRATFFNILKRLRESRGG